MDDNGWIKLSRSLVNHWLWGYTPFSYGQAWIDLLLLANFEDAKMLYKGQIITCKRGDVNYSISFLADRWKWGRKKVKGFLDVLERDGMVTTKATTHRTTITIVNYDNFQCSGTTKGTTKGTTEGTTKAQQGEQPRRTIKERKERKEEKEIIYCAVLDYLNEKANKHFKPSDKNKALIDARLNDGFVLEDFKKVIDIKVAQWLNNPDMNGYLRPITLFSTKFESYLNETPPGEVKPKTKKGSFNTMQNADYDFTELEGLFDGV